MISFGHNHCPDQESVIELLNQAIEATGGRKHLMSYSAITWQERGSYMGLESDVRYQGEYAVQFPDRYRMRIKGAFTIVVNGSQGWINNCGAVNALPAEQMAEYREANHAIWAMQLHPLLDDDSFQLRRIFDHESLDERLVGIRVSCPPYRDLDLYFDPDLMILCKSARKGLVPDFSDDVVTMETDYQSHSRVGGILLPTRMTMSYDGRRVLETTTGEYELHCDLDEKLFEIPRP